MTGIKSAEIKGLTRDIDTYLPRLATCDTKNDSFLKPFLPLPYMLDKEIILEMLILGISGT